MPYDVFISFRGEEIRRTFLSHLIYSLDRKGLRSVSSAASYSSETHAIMESLVVLSVISKHLTSLDGWVEEMAGIIAFERKSFPIFLQINPLDLLRDVELAENSLDLSEPRRNALGIVNNWLRDHVTNKSGFDSRDWMDDSQLVDMITCFVSDTVKQNSSLGNECLSLNWAQVPKLENTSKFKKDRNALSLGVVHSSRPSETPINSSRWGKVITSVPSHSIPSSARRGKFVGKNMSPFAERRRPSENMKRRAEEILSMLWEGSTKEVRTIGIYGMKGVGKTTLAKHLYEEISPQFQHHFYMNKFSNGVTSLAETVGRKVLLIADSVDDTKQLEEASLFGPGSRVIVITQDRSLLVQCGVEHIYEVGCPQYEEAIEIFSRFAFAKTNPIPPGFQRLSGRAVEVAGRVPLALKVLGSFLYGRSKDVWESTLLRLEASERSYLAREVLKYIGEDDTTPTDANILELEENEANSFPLYSFQF